MRTGTIIDASRALAFVRSHATTLGQVEQLPWLVGRGGAKASLAQLMTQAADDAERAATTLLGVEGFSPASVDAIRTAARTLRHTPPDAAVARRAADSLRRSADAAQASWASSIERDPSLAAAQLRQLMATDADTLARHDWTILRRLLAATTEGAGGGPRRIEGSPSFDQVASRHESLRAWTRADMTDARRYFATWRLGEMPAQVRTEAGELLQRSPGALATDDWRAALMLLDSDPHGNALPRTRKLDRLPAVRDVVERRAKGPPPRGPEPDVWTSRDHATIERYQAAWRLEGSTAKERTGILRALLARDPANLDQRDWANVHALLVDSTLGLDGPRHLDGLIRFDEIAAKSVERPSVGRGFAVNRYLSGWRHLLDPDYPAKVASALDDVGRGSSSPDARKIVAAEGHRLAELVEGRAPNEQAAIAAVMLEIPDIAATRSVRGTLEVLRGALASGPPDANLEAVRVETLELIERNLSRLAGVTPDGAVRGWRNNPDYAEIGRIRQNVVLFDHIWRAERAAAEVAAGGVETLAW